MAEKQTQVNVAASGSLGGLTGSVEITVSPKPPWQRLKDRADKIIAIGKVYPFLKLLEWVWEHVQPYVQPFLGRKCQPAEDGQL